MQIELVWEELKMNKVLNKTFPFAIFTILLLSILCVTMIPAVNAQIKIPPAEIQINPAQITTRQNSVYNNE